MWAGSQQQQQQGKHSALNKDLKCSRRFSPLKRCRKNCIYKVHVGGSHLCSGGLDFKGEFQDFIVCMHTCARVYAPVRVYMCACGVLGSGKESTDCSPVSAGELAAKASTIKELTSATLKLASAGRRNPAQVHSVDSLFGLSV